MNGGFGFVAEKIIHRLPRTGACFKAVIVTDDQAARRHFIVKETDTVKRRLKEIDVNMYESEGYILNVQKSVGDPPRVVLDVRELFKILADRMF